MPCAIRLVGNLAAGRNFTSGDTDGCTVRAHLEMGLPVAAVVFHTPFTFEGLVVPLPSLGS